MEWIVAINRLGQSAIMLNDQSPFVKQKWRPVDSSGNMEGVPHLIVPSPRPFSTISLITLVKAWSSELSHIPMFNPIPED